MLFSSHLLDEVEAVADHVTMIDGGRIVLSAPLDAIKQSHRVGERVPSLDEIFIARVGRPAASPPFDSAQGGPERQSNGAAEG